MSVNQQELDALEFRLRTILPEEYRDSYQEVQPVSMGSAGLKYSVHGEVAWDEMWGSFCDLAMAGGPPHKGMLLEPAHQHEIAAHPDRYAEVVAEICRGITLVTYLETAPSPIPGWVRVGCFSDAMSSWLLRAIVMENVAARRDGVALDLPAGPAFRLEKEIKNVVTVIAKTCHYWSGHMQRVQQLEVADLLEELDAAWPLIEPAASSDGVAPPELPTPPRMTDLIRRGSGLEESGRRYHGWLGVECPTIRAAVWMMRALVASNILSRREGTVLYVPVNPASDPDGDTVAQAVVKAHSFAAARGVL